MESLGYMIWPTTTGKGKEKEVMPPTSPMTPPTTPPPELESTGSENHKELRMQFVDFYAEPEYLQRVELLPEQFEFYQPEGKPIYLAIHPPPNSRSIYQLPPCQSDKPRISISYRLYRNFLSAWHFESSVHGPGCPILIEEKLIQALCRNFQVRIPVNHPYLKDYDLLTTGPGVDSHDMPLRPLDSDIIHYLLGYCGRRDISIMKSKPDGGWAVDEQLSYLFNHSRRHWTMGSIRRAREMRSFCNGEGPSDWSVYAKRVIDGEIKKHKSVYSDMPFTAPKCFAYLYEDEKEWTKIKNSIRDVMKGFTRAGHEEKKKKEKRDSTSGSSNEEKSKSKPKPKLIKQDSKTKDITQNSKTKDNRQSWKTKVIKQNPNTKDNKENSISPSISVEKRRNSFKRFCDRFRKKDRKGDRSESVDVSEMEKLLTAGSENDEVGNGNVEKSDDDAEVILGNGESKETTEEKLARADSPMEKQFTPVLAV